MVAEDSEVGPELETYTVQSLDEESSSPSDLDIRTDLFCAPKRQLSFTPRCPSPQLVVRRGWWASVASSLFVVDIRSSTR